MIEAIKYFFEKKAFGVCTYLGEKIGISSSRIRLYFVYTSFITLGSPLIIYLVLAFWVNLRKYIYKKRSSIWDL
jgi:phage shock protein PspC (stress-responsive transcriptional regulator)